MSYIDTIPVSEIHRYQQITEWSRVFQNAITDFQNTYPGGDFSLAELKIERKIFTNDVPLTGKYECNLEFIDCYFKRELIFYELTARGNISFRQCCSDSEVRIMNSSVFNSQLNFSDFKVARQVYIDGGDFNECNWSFSDQATVKLSGGNFKKLNIGYWGGCNLEYLSIDCRKLTGLVRVIDEKSNIKHLSISQPASDLTVSIEDISVNCISIYRFRNDKSFRISNLKSKLDDKPTEFCIVESYLGKAEFYSVDFSQFENFYLTDAHLTECSFVNIKWKFDIDSFIGRGIYRSEKQKELEEKITKLKKPFYLKAEEEERISKSSDVVDYYLKNKEVYRQLKFSLSKQGDAINEQKFHSAEMRIYNKALSIENDPWTKLIIKMSYWFSDFGQSFSRPVIALFIGHWVIFVLLTKCGGFEKFTIDIANANSHAFKLAFEQYFRLMNPLRRAENTFSGYNIMFDIFMRIWSSYMIYNIVRATRRFIK